MLVPVHLRARRSRSRAAPAVADNRWILQLALWSIPLPWIAAELGWIVAEYGRQPWTISEVLPTHLSVSSPDRGRPVSSASPASSFFYTALLVVEIYLMLKYAGSGPRSLGTGRYHHETPRARTVEGTA